MKKSIFAFMAFAIIAMFCTTGCFDKKASADDTLKSDSALSDTAIHDSLEDIIAEQPMPKAADELFDDFIFNYAANRKVQKERTSFPVLLDNFGKQTELLQSSWNMEHFFMRQGYYTLIFNNPRQMNLVKDTAVNSVYVEKISVRKNFVKRWEFNRVNGMWRMNKVTLMPLSKHEDASFFRFYDSFASDTAVQVRSLCESVNFSGPDPEDDFSRLNGDIMPEQWLAFAPWMPKGALYNIHYGSKPYKPTNVRLFIIRGIANGLETELTFIRQGGKWRLKKLNT